MATKLVLTNANTNLILLMSTKKNTHTQNKNSYLFEIFFAKIKNIFNSLSKLVKR